MFIDCELGKKKRCCFCGESKGELFCGIAKGVTNLSEMKVCPEDKDEKKDKRKK